MESTRKLKNSTPQLQQQLHIKAKPGDDQPPPPGRQMFVDEINEELIVPRSLNGIFTSRDQPVDVTTHKTLAFLFHPQNGQGESVDRGVAGVQQPVKGYEWIEMGVKRQVVGARVEEAENRMGSVATEEPGSVFGNDRVQSAPPDSFRGFAARPLRHSTAGLPVLLVGEYPAVDYPMNEDSDSPSSAVELSSAPGEGLSAMRDLDYQPGNQDTRMSPNRPGDVEIHTWSFSHNLKSPGLRRRRPNGSSHGPFNQSPRHHLNSSFYTSHSDHNWNNKRNSIPSVLGLDLPHVSVPKGTWNTAEIPPDPHTVSESELPTRNFNEKCLPGRTQRSASIPNITTQHERRPNSRSLITLPQCRQNSPLEGLIERARERVKERHTVQNDRSLRVADPRIRHPPPSPSFSTPHSASPSDGDRETEEEVEVELTRYRALAVSEGWKEQLVDGDEDYKRDRSVWEPASTVVPTHGTQHPTGSSSNFLKLPT